MRRLLALGVIVPSLGACAVAVVCAQTPVVGDELAWRELVRDGSAALTLGDDTGARRAVDRLTALRPRHPIAIYLSARLLERDGAWGAAADRYREILVDNEALPEPGLDPDAWGVLVSGRWARAARLADESLLRAALDLSTPPDSVPGRVLVLPLEPLILDESTTAMRAQTTALGVAAAAQVIDALAGVPGTDPLSLHTSLLVRRGQVPDEPAGGNSAAIDRDLPPVTTPQGAAMRLELLEPAGPPPWAPDAARASRYLDRGAARSRIDAVASALAHFQSEHGLAPTGVLDPETRQSLERAFRQARSKRPWRTWTMPGVDPLLGTAQLLGAEATLTGTLEADASGFLRWSAAWSSTHGGTFLAPPLTGVLPRGEFAAAWARMIELIVQASPPCQRGAAWADRSAPLAHDGAVRVGQAFLQLEEGCEVECASLLARAAKAGAGSHVRWLATAWGRSTDDLARLERELLDSVVAGPLVLDAAALIESGDWLARGLIGSAAASADGRVSVARAQGLAGLPEHGWLRVIGEVE